MNRKPLVNFTPSDMLITLLIPVALILICIVLYNTLIARKNDVIMAFGSIDVMLKMRHDLIPNIVEVRKNFGCDLKISFSDSNLYLAISLERDFISPSYVGPIISFRRIQVYGNYLNLLFHLVKDLKLEPKTVQ